jgi:hypothetical protein
MNRLSSSEGRHARVLAGLAVVCGVLHAHPARACTTIPTLTPGHPTASATEVPLDAAPWFYAHAFGVDDLAVRLLGPEDVEVPITLSSFFGGVFTYVEVWPDTALEPDTHYRLVVDAELENHTQHLEIAFTTGSTVAPEPPPAPEAAMELLELTYIDSCYPGHIACAGSEGAAVLDARLVDPDGGDVLDQQLGHQSMLLLYTEHASDRPFCLELRHRTPSGERSDASTLCSDEVPTFTANFLNEATCHAGLLEGLPPDPTPGPDTEPAGADSGGGCSLTYPSARTAPPLPWILLLGLLLLARGRRERRTAP